MVKLLCIMILKRVTENNFELFFDDKLLENFLTPQI